MNAAGHHYDGHTEIYAAFTNTRKYAMMLAHEDFRVIHVSTHVSLREACDRVKKARVLDVIRMADAECRRIGIEKPKIGVAGLNPHCGEGGLFGREEIDEIQPAIDEAVAEGINVTVGLPIIRVSVDHGTGEDIAGLGIAEPASLLNSIEYATISAENRF